MGCVSSKSSAAGADKNPPVDIDGSEHGGGSEDTHWRIEPQKALNKFLHSGSDILDKDFDYFSDDEFVELRTILDEPLGRSHFLAHINHYKPCEADLVKMWLLLHSYHHNDQGADARYQLCKSLYKHYFYITPEEKARAECHRDSNCKLDECSPGSIPEEPTTESSFAKYRQLLVPERCRGFEERVIATIVQLRPRVETALWEGRATAQESPRGRGRSSSGDSQRPKPQGSRRFSSSIDVFVDIGAPGGIVDISPHGGIGVDEPYKRTLNSSPPKTSSDALSAAAGSAAARPAAMGSSPPSAPGRTSDLSRAAANSNGGLPQLSEAMEQAKVSGPGLDLFLTLQNEVFKEMRPLYHHFKETSEDYGAYRKSKKIAYNRVEPNDFKYLSNLGKGGFGHVVHVIKKSTGAHYAMKIQAKDTLTETWNGKMQHVEIERDVLVAHRSFPFIVSLRYAFQDAKYAFLALDLAEHGSLRAVLEDLPGWQMQVPQVRLYVAEIVLALECLHDHGIIYRDLKPENVLLFADGHIMLADMGLAGFYYQDKYHEDDEVEQMTSSDAALLLAAKGCASDSFKGSGANSSSSSSNNNDPKLDVRASAAKEMEDEDADLFEEGNESSSKMDMDSSATSLESAGASVSSASSNVSSLSDQKNQDTAEQEKNDYQNRKSRVIQSHNTDCGTTLYRPPEMVKHEHYNEGVDYFMLGVFIYECLCATLPWMPKMDQDGEIAIDTEEDELKVFRKRLRIPTHLGEATIDIISGLLDLDPERRLGVGPAELKRDFESLKSHKFFVPLGGPLATECDWDKVLERGYNPVYIPREKELDSHANFSNFASLVKHWKKLAKKEAKDNAKRKGVKVDYDIQDITEGKEIDPALEHYFDNWDYTDPSSILAEKEVETSRSARSGIDKIESRKSLGLKLQAAVSRQFTK